MKKKISMLVILVGLVLFLVGLFLPVPGTELTTYQSLDGKTSSYSGEKYSSIEEYVGGDAYNYIIGASLVGGRIAGAKTQKAVFIAGGLLIASMGALSWAGEPADREKSILSGVKDFLSSSPEDPEAEDETEA